MASRLVPCPSCSRHVKLGPPSCPFCGGEVPADAPARPVAMGRPLSRAAILFASAAAVTACSSSTTSPTPAKDGGGHSDAQAQPAYGVFVDAGVHKAHDAGAPDMDGSTVALYGVFIDDAARTPDAGPFPDGGPVAAYGGFVNPDGGH